jgi:HEAT repeat protein/glycosyl hydrolase family 2
MLGWQAECAIPVTSGGDSSTIDWLHRSLCANKYDFAEGSVFMSAIIRCVVAVVGGLGLCICSTAAAPEAPGDTASLAEKRAALMQCAEGTPEAIAHLTQALDEDNLILRRTAVRLLRDLGAQAKEALDHALDNDDVVVRCSALWAICSIPEVDPLPYLSRAIGDDEGLVRQAAVAQLAAIEPRTDGIIALLKVAQQDSEDSVRSVASDTLWPFRGGRIPLRERKDYDHDITVSQTIPLPKDGWRFRLDPGRVGHLKDWFKPTFKDEEWDLTKIEQVWQEGGYEHVGVAWYRRWIELPAEPKHTAVELNFKGVDECAWVWVNGVYVGKHDVGPVGWNLPFLLNVTEEIRWGEKNQITIRAMNTQHGGGIWQPVLMEVLQ